MKSLAQFLDQHSFTRGLDSRFTKILIDCARSEFAVGEYLWRPGDVVNECHLLGSGEVAVGISVPHQGQLQIDTVGGGDIVGVDRTTLQLVTGTKAGLGTFASSRETAFSATKPEIQSAHPPRRQQRSFYVQMVQVGLR